MKKIIFLCTIICIALIFISCNYMKFNDVDSKSNTASAITSNNDSMVLSDIVWVDENFKKEVSIALKKPAEEVTLSDLEIFTEITVNDAHIRFNEISVNYQENNTEPVKLDDLIHFKNITSLDFTSRLNTYDLSVISKLTKLKTLSLTGETISSLPYLNNLNDLTEFNLSETLVEDLQPLSQANSLKKVVLYGNAINHISPLANLSSLESLIILAEDAIDDVAVIGGITTLKGLGIEFVNFTDASFLSNLKSLSALNIVGADIDDISSISELYELEALIIDITNVSDVSPLKNLTKLSFLSLRDNEISDISVLSNLTNLKEVDLIENYITDLTPVAHVAKVNNRYKTGNGIGYSP